MKRFACVVFFFSLLSSCKVFYPDKLFKIEEEKLALADSIKTPAEYVIQPGDLLNMAVFSNNGYELIDVFTRENSAFSPLHYLVNQSGFIFLPMLDSVNIAGMTIAEAERMLISRYSYYFVNPFIRIEVTNRSVYVFRGRSGASVVTLDKENMNLLEVLAKAGGMPPGGKAYRVRILRGNPGNPTVFDIDLSTIEGMRQANMTLEANDVVYVESRLTSNDVLLQITPVISLVSSLLLIATLYITFTK